MPGEVGSRVDLGKGEAMGLEGSKMALGVIVNWSLPRTAGMGCHTGQESAASPLTQQGEGRAGSQAVGRREGEALWTSGSEVSTGTPGGGRGAREQDGWNSTE